MVDDADNQRGIEQRTLPAQDVNASPKQRRALTPGLLLAHPWAVEVGHHVVRAMVHIPGL